jgi:hypothetical protein
MEEGPESEYALASYHLDVLFKNSQTMFFINTERIRQINSILPPLINIYVKHIQDQASKDIQKLPDNMQEQFTSLLNTLFVDRTKSTSISIIDEKSDALHEKLIHASSVSYQLPKFILEMSFVYLVAKFEDLLSKELQIVFTRKSEVLKPIPRDKVKTEEKKVTYHEVFAAPDLNELKDKIVEREIKRINTDARFGTHQGRFRPLS